MSGTSSQIIRLVDTHAHLDDERFRASMDDVLDRAIGDNVTQIIAIGTTRESSEAVVELARTRMGIFAAVGIHPNDAAQASSADWNRIVELAGRPKVVAVGETGLDRYWKRTPFPEQQEWFDRHLTLGHEKELPVVIHCRDAQRDIIEQLKRLHRKVIGVMHSFTGTWEDASACLELGLHLSFAGMVTFTNKNLDALRDVAARVPLDRLLVETDSPYLTPHPFRGSTNEPARVALTAERLAEIRGLSPAALAQATTANAQKLFRLSDLDVLTTMRPLPT
jgi:TatD DNase family protein